MAKLSANEVKGIDLLQETVHNLKQSKFKSLGDYGKYIKSLSHPSREQKAIIVYSVLDMAEAEKYKLGDMSTEKLTAILKPIGELTGIALPEMFKILIQLLSDSTYFIRTAKEFKAIFEESTH